mmetsp:Transcript_4623/g.5060  ORF Transcript_4623/g.5060 Transcript_4623/m.5060 type:complete len:321 (+) Transcript_4623:60-1022(+)
MEKRELQIYFLSILSAVLALLAFIRKVFPHIQQRLLVAYEKRQILKRIDSKNLSEAIDESDLKPSPSITREKPATTQRRKPPNYFLQAKPHQQTSDKTAIKDDPAQSKSKQLEGLEKIHTSENRTEAKALNNLRRRRDRETRLQQVSSPLPTPPSASISSSEIRALQDLEYELCLRKDEEELEKRRMSEQRINELRKRFEQEPEGNDESIVTICFRVKGNFPSSEKGAALSQIKRRFSVSDSVGSLLDYVESVYMSEIDSSTTHQFKSFEVFCFSPQPLRLERDIAGLSSRKDISVKESSSLQDAGILKNTVFWVKFDSS